MIQPTNAQQPIPQQGGANAVSINIFNPQAYGGNAGQQTPYDYTNSLYNVPQTSVYNPGMQYMTQQYMPQENAQNPIQQPTAAAIPAPQMMPGSVLEQTPNQETTEVQEAPKAQETNNVETTEQAEQEPAVQINTDELINNLKSTDAKVRESAINQLAEYAQSEDANVAKQVVTEPVMQTLVDIISEDTSGLQGPTDEQVKVAEKVAKGEQLTPEEEKISEELSPRDSANQNRMFALYTLAMLQKTQRDEVDEYIASQKENGQQTIEPLKINDVYGYDSIVNTINNDSRPEVKVAAIQSLKYIARPEDAQTVKDVLAESLKSNDEEVKNTAQETVDALEKQ